MVDYVLIGFEVLGYPLLLIVERIFKYIQDKVFVVRHLHTEGRLEHA
jgi:hypothetical protein